MKSHEEWILLESEPAFERTPHNSGQFSQTSTHLAAGNSQAVESHFPWGVAPDTPLQSAQALLAQLKYMTHYPSVPNV